ncbi:MAG: quinolinate synthase NadA [Clostridium sp.]|jgi:quinolinate synthase|uniref:quinolinate synthase NadA n=1 Tax=Clostridium sp. TaxID=1506 RepID=UPI0025BC0C49|nr:quinolinate synthase NadA [Clostridium sp.]MCH3962901.1 quinolinate synthase NadA [Clostridium sp.]MCI1715684.1 quinolinate synthase NadA [Clostridium sp.]MCI1800111.1 quinolinate synthase NadA [Clostridium sp.]MCI1814025.1 quinolinate synthase NadA [Clostridium sp.]MCI1870923.1 quinolinate synthase NadA [Clostridium sp.]
MDKSLLIEEINRLKAERDACILAHNYQIPDVQDIADIVGDSFALSRAAADLDNKVIVFCGVRFMAESAKILSPDKIVLLPAANAGCPLADSIDEKQLEREKKNYPDAKVVCYINSSAEVKAASDICCTSSNAVKVVDSIDSEQVIFVPDQNLASYVAEKVENKKIIPWLGNCITHVRITMEDVFNIKREHPEAEMLVHPEVSEEIRADADFVGSTSQIIDYAQNSKCQEFIIGTEIGVLHKMQNDSPQKKFYLLSKRLVCENMKMTSLYDVYRSLMNMDNEVIVPEDVSTKALSSLDRMLSVK